MFMPFVLLFTAMIMVPPNYSCYDVVVLRAARGYDARLPCGQGKVFLDGPRAYVVWLKDDKDFLYRFPEDESATRSLDPNTIYGTTCKAGVCYDETSLLLNKVSDKDGGLYTCRVHYQASPSDEFMVEIRLVEPAGKPHIHTDTGETPENISPISIGANLTLICFLVDGPKDAVLYWERNGEPIPSYTLPGENSIEIQITNVTWAENNVKYECLAQNADVSQPFTTSHIIKMDYAVIPTKAQLDTYDPIWEANRKAEIMCEFMAENDSSTFILWYLDGARFQANESETKQKGKYITSTLRFIPTMEEDKSKLRCEVRQPGLKLLSETHTTIHIGKRPVCDSIDAMHDEEKLNDDILTIKCLVRSAIRPTQFYWSLTNTMIVHNNIGDTSSMVIKQFGKERYYSILKWTSKMPKGQLGCWAKNEFGMQLTPCLYTVLPSSPPNTPHCEINRFNNNNTIHIDCPEGFNDGYYKTVFMELQDSQGRLITNMSNIAGEFKLNGISEKKSYTVVVYASNIRGQSAKMIRSLPAVGLPTTPDPEINEGRQIKGWENFLLYLVILGAMMITVAFAMGGAYFTILYTGKKCLEVSGTPPRRLVDGNFQREPDVVGDAITTESESLQEVRTLDIVQTPPGPTRNVNATSLQLQNELWHAKVPKDKNITIALVQEPYVGRSMF